MLGLVRPGYAADLLIVDRNPAYNLAFLYGFGANTLDDSGQMVRSAGVVHTIKDGIVMENARLLEEVAKMVKASRPNGLTADVATAPFLP